MATVLNFKSRNNVSIFYIGNNKITHNNWKAIDIELLSIEQVLQLKYAYIDGRVICQQTDFLDQVNAYLISKTATGGGTTGSTGATGPTGAQGVAGPAGAGLPRGGAVGQIPVKKSADDYDIEWQNVGGSIVKNRITALLQYDNSGMISGVSIIETTYNPLTVSITQKASNSVEITFPEPMFPTSLYAFAKDSQGRWQMKLPIFTSASFSALFAADRKSVVIQGITASNTGVTAGGQVQLVLHF